MKKGILFLVMLFVVGSLLVACGGENNENTAPEQEVNNEQSETTTDNDSNKNEEGSEEEGNDQSEPQPKADPLVVSVDKLVEDLDNNALNASNTYKGKYVEVTGQLATIDSGGKYFSLNPMNDSFTMTNVRCDITQEQVGTVSKFTQKQKVIVTGTITDVGEIMGYSLKVESIK